MNRTQLTRTDLTAICQRNSCWYSWACDVLGLHPPAHSRWNRGWTPGFVPRDVLCLSTTVVSWPWRGSQSWWPPTVISSHTGWYCCITVLFWCKECYLRVLQAWWGADVQVWCFWAASWTLWRSFRSCSSDILAQLCFWRVKKVVAYSRLHLDPLMLKGCRAGGLPLPVD